MMASAAAATSVVLGTEVEIGTPETKTFTAADAIADAYPATPHAVRAAMSICGEPCRLVQLVPNAFVVRMTSALDELGAEVAGAPAGRSAGGPRGSPPPRPSLAGIPVRVWAELGRARMPSAQVVGLPAGAVVELDSRPTTRSISSSTARTSRPAAWSSSTEPTGPCASSTCSM